jgi:hypothetical protein
MGYEQAIMELMAWQKVLVDSRHDSDADHDMGT